MNRKSTLCLIGFLLVVTLIISLVGCGSNENGEPSKPSQEFYVFGSCGPGGVWYTLVGGMTTLLSNEIEGVIFTSDVTGCSGENVRRLERGEQDFALLHATHAFQAQERILEFESEEPYKNIRALAEVFFSPQTLVTIKGRGITTLSDLEGRKINFGPAGSGTAYNTELWLDILGINVEGLTVGFAESADMLRDGHIDVMCQAGAPSTAITELAAVEDIYIIPFSDEEIAKIREEHRYYLPYQLKANTYVGQPDAVQMPGFSVQWFAHVDTPEEIVYKALEIAYSEAGQKHLSSVHPNWKEIRPAFETMDSLGFTLHPGAKKFYEDNPHLLNR